LHEGCIFLPDVLVDLLVDTVYDVGVLERLRLLNRGRLVYSVDTLVKEEVGIPIAFIDLIVVIIHLITGSHLVLRLSSKALFR